MPTAGDTSRFSVAAFDSTVLFTFADTGANKVWNYDSIIPLRQGVREFLTSAQTPYNISGKMAQKVADTIAYSGISIYDVYDFYSNSTSAFEINQRGARVPFGPLVAPITPTYADPDQVYEFPLNYLDRDSNSFNLVFNNIFSPAYYSTSGYRINEVEAWGSMSTPYGTFNCLKVKTDLVTYDTVSFGTLNFGITRHTRDYKWITPSLTYPAMILSGNVVNGVFIPVNLQYRDSVRNLPGLFAPLALFTADTTNIFIGDTLQMNNLSLSIIAPSFNWSVSPSTFNYVNGSTSNSAEPFFEFTDTGYYDIQLVVDNGQGRDTLLREDYIHVSSTVSIEEISKSEIEQVDIYPNPLKGSSMQIKTKGRIERVRLLDMRSRLIKEWQGNQQNQMQLQFDNKLPPSTYYLQLDISGKHLSKKLIVQ